MLAAVSAENYINFKFLQIKNLWIVEFTHITLTIDLEKIRNKTATKFMLTQYLKVEAVYVDIGYIGKVCECDGDYSILLCFLITNTLNLKIFFYRNK